MLEGGFEDFTISSGKTRNNTFLEGNRRIAYAYLLANHPETFEKIEKDNVILFYGTRVEALPSILKHGMKSFSESSKDGITVTTGEQSTRLGGNRDFISFTDDIATALQYTGITSQNPQEQSFGVMLGMSTDSLKQLKICSVYSDTPEVGIQENIPVDHIKMLIVPPGKEEIVKNMVGDLPIEVVTMNIEDPFYGMTRYEMKKELGIVGQAREEKAQLKVETSKKDDEIQKETIPTKQFKGIRSFIQSIKGNISSLFGKQKEVKLLTEQTQEEYKDNANDVMLEKLQDGVYPPQSSKVIEFDNVYHQTQIEEQDITIKQ